MKILFWGEGFWPRIGGSETQGLQFLRGMQGRGHQSVVVAQKDDPSMREEETHAGIAIRRFDFNAVIERRDLRVIRSIQTYLDGIMKEFQPDIIHLNACIGGSAFAFSLFMNMFCSPIVATAHVPYFQKNQFLPTMEKIASSVDQICCVSKWTLAVMEESFPLLRNKIRLIYNGLPMPKMAPSPLSFSPPIVLLLGRLSSEKGFETAIEAFYFLKKEGSNAQMLIAGEGPEKPFLEHMVDKWGLTDSVRFTGRVAIDEVPSVINQATLVIVPSSFESFGLVALEAMQMGRPVIASNVGGLREIVSNGETGLLVPSQDPIALCQAIQSLLEQPEKAVEMGIQGRKQAMEKFPASRNVSQYEDLYKELLQASKLIGSSV